MAIRNSADLHRPILLSLSTLLTFGLTAGCNEDEALRAFREAAASSLQNGFTSIAGGLIDGAFAVFELGSEDASTTGGETAGETTGETPTGEETTGG